MDCSAAAVIRALLCTGVTLAAFSEKTWPLLLVPKMRTDTWISLRGSRRLPKLSVRAGRAVENL